MKHLFNIRDIPVAGRVRNIFMLLVTFLVAMSLTSTLVAQLKSSELQSLSPSQSLLDPVSNEPEMILIPAGSVRTPEPFPRKSNFDDDHIIAVNDAFYISKYEITFDQWGRGNRPVINVAGTISKNT